MVSYIFRRVLATLPVMAIVALLVFSLLYIAPGDPAAVIAGDQASPADGERIRQSLSLHRPVLVQVRSRVRAPPGPGGPPPPWSGSARASASTGRFWSSSGPGSGESCTAISAPRSL